MNSAESTCWTVIRAAAKGSSSDREELGRRYLDVVRAYLAARWRESDQRQDIEDAVQEVFIECFRDGGVLEKVTSGSVSGFRAFLYGVVRNVARRFESRPSRKVGSLAEVEANEASLSQLFDRVWAQSVMKQAAERQRQLAETRGPDAVQRVELLRLRFEANMPIREIAELWKVPADRLHHTYAQARKDFRAALLDVVAFHHPGSQHEVEQEAASLLKELS